MPDLFLNYPKIKDDILEIRKIRESDLSQLVHLFPYELTDKQAEAMLQQFDVSFQNRKSVISGIIEKEKLIGVIQLRYFTARSVEIGYRMALQKQHLGLTKHAVKMMVQYLLNRGYESIEAFADENNIASIRILEDNGFTKIKQTENVIRYQKRRG